MGGRNNLHSKVFITLCCSTHSISCCYTMMLNLHCCHLMLAHKSVLIIHAVLMATHISSEVVSSHEPWLLELMVWAVNVKTHNWKGNLFYMTHGHLKPVKYISRVLFELVKTVTCNVLQWLVVWLNNSLYSAHIQDFQTAFSFLIKLVPRAGKQNVINGQLLIFLVVNRWWR